MGKQTVVVGMSGGVDSSVAAYLLKEQGYDVIGVTMQIWQAEDQCSISDHGGCCGLSAVEDARNVASQLHIPHYVINFRSEFEKYVIDYFVDEYERGRTPNPCIACNRFIKWESLLSRSVAIGADAIATGHYARIDKLANGRFCIRTSATAQKDQTYALYNLTQEQLSRTKMPVGEYTKEEIRTIARQLGLQVADKPDSQEICFVPDRDYAGFIFQKTKKQYPPGNFVSTDGRVLGRHQGIIHYTVGQRKGLGLAVGHPVFVTAIVPERNEVVIGEDADVWGDTLQATCLNWMAMEQPAEEISCVAKIRYSHAGAPCRVRMVGNDRMECRFEEPVRAITPGQAVVLYDGEYVLGGGVIL